MSGKCFICNISEQDEVTYGEFLSKSRFSVHYFCLLLSTNLCQQGQNDGSGFRRFLISDIVKLVRNITETKCSYCGKGNASVYCSKCPIVFHQICGSRNGCLYEFDNEFKAHCPAHIAIEEQPYSEGERCIICEERLGEYDVTSVVPTCCFRGWSHIQCIRRYALNAGYYFKCFVCRNTEYKTVARSRGVYVPDRDAVWEREVNAYKELEKRRQNCDATECMCDLGRKFVSKTGSWRILLCASCGFFGMHAFCVTLADIPLIAGTFNCELCKAVLDATMNATKFDMNDTLVEGVSELEPTVETYKATENTAYICSRLDGFEFTANISREEDVQSLGDEKSLRRPRSTDKSSNEVPEVVPRQSQNTSNICSDDADLNCAILGSTSSQTFTEADTIVPRNAEHLVPMEFDADIIILSDDNSSDIGMPEKNVYGRKDFAARGITGNLSIEEEARFSDTSSSVGDGVTGNLSIEEEARFSDISSSLGDLETPRRALPAFELSNEASADTSIWEDVAISDISSSIGDGESSRRPSLAYKTAIEVPEVVPSRTLNENNCTITGSSHLITEVDTNIARDAADVVAMEVDDAIFIYSDIIIVSDDDSSDISGMLEELSRPKKCIDGRVQFGGSDKELYARRIALLFE